MQLALHARSKFRKLGSLWKVVRRLDTCRLWRTGLGPTCKTAGSSPRDPTEPPSTILYSPKWPDLVPYWYRRNAVAVAWSKTMKDATKLMKKTIQLVIISWLWSLSVFNVCLNTFLGIGWVSFTCRNSTSEDVSEVETDKQKERRRVTCAPNTWLTEHKRGTIVSRNDCRNTQAKHLPQKDKGSSSPFGHSSQRIWFVRREHPPKIVTHFSRCLSEVFRDNTFVVLPVASLCLPFKFDSKSHNFPWSSGTLPWKLTFNVHAQEGQNSEIS